MANKTDIAIVLKRTIYIMHIYCMSYLAKQINQNFADHFSYFMSHKITLISSQIKITFIGKFS